MEQVQTLSKDEGHTHGNLHADGSGLETHNIIGLSLVLGFLLMLLIDQCAGAHHKPGKYL